MKICVTSMYNEAFKEIANVSILNNFKKYCLLHNYTFEPILIESTLDRHASWWKIYTTLNLLKSNKYDWIFWIDADCLFMNTTIDLERFIDEDYFMIIGGIDDAPEPKILNSHGSTAIFAGQFLIKNCQQSINYLSDVWEAKETSKDFFKFDHEMRQMRISGDREEFKEGIKIIDLHYFNTFWYSNSPFFLFGNPHYNEHCWKIGDFIVHVVQGIGPERVRCLSDLNYFSGGAFVNCHFKSDRIIVSPLYDMENITFFVKTLDGNNIINYNLPSVISKYSYNLFLTTELDCIKLEGYNNKYELISLNLLNKESI